MNPKVSVIIPAYNCGPLVTEALESVRRQTWQDFEVIVVDDGSRDGTAARVEPFARSGAVRFFRQTPNQGKTAAIRRGIREATGEVLLIQDADLVAVLAQPAGEGTA